MPVSHSGGRFPDQKGVDLRVAAAGIDPVEAAGQVPGSRLSPAHGRKWVECGMAAFTEHASRARIWLSLSDRS
jgi:hypothetical protein